MGRIKRFNLQKLIMQTKAQYFFETGTWKGDGLAYAAKVPFEKLYSSEIIESIADRAKQRFENDKRVQIIHDSSTQALEKTLPQIKGNCIFWLDAHFPGAEEGLKGYNEFEDEIIKLPLQRELEIISSRKGIYKDVILIDDLRIYEEANYESGNLPDSVLPPKIRNTNFAAGLFGDTHTISKYLNDEGYLVLIPKNLHSLSTFYRFLYSVSDQLSGKII